jgi:hypothetical protein
VALMKQARAFGVGVIVATQNPMDLDYRALSNAGVWCIGRLQTDADRARVMDGFAASIGAERGATTTLARRATSRAALVRNPRRTRGKRHCALTTPLSDVAVARADDAK